MNNEMNLTLFSEDAAIETQEVDEFRYEVLDPEDREFVREKEYEVRANWKRAANEIMEVGKNLLLVQERLKKANKEKHGSFLGWLNKAGLSTYNAYFSMKAFDRFGNDKNFAMQNFSPEVVRELSYASDQIVEQVVAGNVLPTRDDIRKAKKAEKDAKEREKQARQAEAKARAEAVAAQQQLFLLQQTSQTEIGELTKQMEEMKQGLDDISIPEPEIVYVDKEVVPQSVKNNLEKLQKQVDSLNADLEAAKDDAPQEVKDQIKALQVQLDTYKAIATEKETRLEEVRKYNKEIANMNQKLSEEARLMSAETQASVGRARIRQKWRKDTTDLHVSIAKFVAELPSMIDQESLEGDDWARQAQCIEILQRALSALGQMRNSMSDPFVDGSVDASSFSYSPDIVEAEIVR